MICDDCLFQLGIDEYEYHSPASRRRYTCSICDEFVPTSRGYNHDVYMDRIIEKYIGEGEG